MKPRAPRAKIPSEHQTQVAVVQWCAVARAAHPALAWVYAIPNAGKRSVGAYGFMRAEGLRPGIPDLCCPAPVGSYGAAYIEHKAFGNHPTPEQCSALLALAQAGNAVTLSYSFAKSREFLLRYVRGAPVYALDHGDVPEKHRAFVARLDAEMRRRFIERSALPLQQQATDHDHDHDQRFVLEPA